MRQRAQDASGDMTFGRGSSNYLVNSPAAVGQLLGDRLGLWQGEWFLDVTAGTPWMQQILGKGGVNTANAALRKVILQTDGVTSIDGFSDALDGRAYLPTVTVETAYNGQAIATAAPMFT